MHACVRVRAGRKDIRTAFLVQTVILLRGLWHSEDSGKFAELCPKTGAGRGEGGSKTQKAASRVRRAATRWELGSREPGTGKLEGCVPRG